MMVPKPPKPASGRPISHVMRFPLVRDRIVGMDEDLEKARKKLDKEFSQIQESLGEVHVAFDAVRNAGPEANIHDLLKELEKKVKNARDGGVVGSGANAHRRALEKYNHLLAEQESSI